MIITGKTIQNVIITQADEETDRPTELRLEFTDGTTLRVSALTDARPDDLPWQTSTEWLVLDIYQNGQYQGTVTDETEAE